MIPTKEELRSRFKKVRERLSDEEYHLRSRAIVERVLSLPEIEKAKTIHVYWPIINHREIDTRSLIFFLHAQKKQIVLPVVSTFNRNNRGEERLLHVRFTCEAEMRENRWGIREPLSGLTVPISEVDVVIVPALGVGRNYHRIGFGFGYYDEFLGQISAPSICLAYSSCLVEFVPFEAYDRFVSIIVTEDEILRR